MSQKIKSKWLLSRPEAADLLRKIADSIEDGSDEVAGYSLSLAELIKFSIKIEMGLNDSLEVKFEGKGAKIGGTSIEGESYSSLKKRMSIYFKAIRESVAKAEVPSREIVSVFLSDSEKMCSFSGFGDEFYPAYMALCGRLRETFEAEDMGALASVVQEFEQAKKTCHARYK